MNKNSIKFALVYFSPAASTGRAGRQIAGLLVKKGYVCDTYDLTRNSSAVSMTLRSRIDSHDLLVVGTPVYCDCMAPPVEHLLEALPFAEKDVILYAAFGGVGSGAVLMRMAKILINKHYRIIGGAKVRMPHSLMYKAKHPLGQTVQGENDLQLQRMVGEAVNASTVKSAPGITVDELDYQSRFIHMLNKLLFNPPVMNLLFMPRVIFHESKCRNCGTCKTVCPSGRSTTAADKMTDKSCLRCYTCVRHCRHEARTARLERFSGFLHALRILNYPFERQQTRIFTPFRAGV